MPVLVHNNLSNLYLRAGALSVSSTIWSIRWCYAGKYHTKSAYLIYHKLSNKALSTLEPSSRYNPAWITGFVDGECSFGVQCTKSSSNRLCWSVSPVFAIGLHKVDRVVLEQIKSYFGVGDVSNSCSNAVRSRIRSIEESLVIIKHFDKYPLITKKLADYLLWRQAVVMINQKEHLTEEGLRKIVAIKAAINLGLSVKLKKAFPDIIPAQRFLVETNEVSPCIPKIYDSNWLAGFTSADGCFLVSIRKSGGGLKERVRLRFNLTQHSRDEQLMKSLVEYFNCGSCKERTGGLAIDFNVDKFSDITDKIIPFFKEYCIIGQKAEDFKDFCKVAELIKEKKHLTSKGVDQIRQIKAGMNKGRRDSAANIDILVD